MCSLWTEPACRESCHSELSSVTVTAANGPGNSYVRVTWGLCYVGGHLPRKPLQQAQDLEQPPCTHPRQFRIRFEPNCSSDVQPNCHCSCWRSKGGPMIVRATYSRCLNNCQHCGPISRPAYYHPKPPPTVLCLLSYGAARTCDVAIPHLDPQAPYKEYHPHQEASRLPTAEWSITQRVQVPIYQILRPQSTHIESPLRLKYII